MYDDTESPNEGACLRYDEPESPEEEEEAQGCSRNMMSRDRQMRGVYQDV